jgi:metallo-beta-lactamase family protein
MSGETLTFVGGAGTVTGSAFLVETGAGDRILVDCGIYQGPRDLRRLNWEPFPVDPASIDAVVVSHSHVDHSGFLPRLVKKGYSGPILATPHTVELCEIVLPDSGHIQEEQAAEANRYGWTKHDPALPLYTEADARDALTRFESVDFGSSEEVVPGVTLQLRSAGHILGAASVHLTLPSGRRIAFSGDLGTDTHPLLLPPEPRLDADIVVCESTYGDEVRTDDDIEQRFLEVVDDTLRQSGVVVIPAFAVDRTEIVLWHLDRLTREGRLPSVPVFVDSPMASAALAVYRRAMAEGHATLRPHVDDHTTGDGEVFSSIDLRETRTVEQSKEITGRRGPFIVVSASGMASGGRVLHHLQSRLGDPRNSVVLVGFQAPGTRGSTLLAGARGVKFFGSYHQVRARVEGFGLSAHADQRELLAWIESGSTLPEVVYVVHGEEEASATLADAVNEQMSTLAVCPRRGERVVV